MGKKAKSYSNTMGEVNTADQHSLDYPALRKKKCFSDHRHLVQTWVRHYKNINDKLATKQIHPF
jgi:hypothetical protein